jgi:hypothetical protein
VAVTQYAARWNTSWKTRDAPVRSWSSSPSCEPCPIAVTFRRMADLLGVLGVAAAVFASTNVDDVFLLAAFFADPHLRPGP